MTFTQFNLNQKLLDGLEHAEYFNCMPVQKQVLKHGLTGVDLYVQSQTGTGKTAAYLITIFQLLQTNHTLKNNQALILVPTRELAVQVKEEAQIIARALPYTIASFYGGVGYEKQHKSLDKGVDIVIGTPGRIIDLQESGTMDLSNIGFLVIDEADRMFDMGFYPDLRTLIKVLPSKENRQTMLFSATLNTWVKNLAWEYTKNAKEIEIEAENITVEEIEQLLFHISSEEKMNLLLGIIHKEKPDSLIIFCNTKKMSEIVSKRLNINNISSEYLIGDLPQSKRLHIINSFKSGSLQYLVATDVAARGIDVEDLAMVINYDLPNEAENYVHRIGRTARAGKSGKAYSLCSEYDVYNLPAIEKYLENKIPSCVPGEDDLFEDASKNIYITIESNKNDFDTKQTPRHKKHIRKKTTSKQQYREHSKYTTNKKHKSGFSKSQKNIPYKKTHYSTTKPTQQKNIHRPDLSRLTFEERMKYYKKKYYQDATPNAKPKPTQEKPKPTKNVVSKLKKLYKKES